jgi:WD40 repeat protein
VWDIKVHPFESIFLSVGSDSTTAMWQISNNHHKSQSSSKSILTDNSFESKQSLLHRFEKKSYIGGFALNPTSCAWIPHEPNSFAVSYQDPHLSIFDGSTGQEKSFMTFKIDDQKNYYSQQINKMVVSEQNKLLIAGTEDNLLRLIDLNSNKVVKTIVGHTDSVTSLMIHHRKN